MSTFFEMKEILVKCHPWRRDDSALSKVNQKFDVRVTWGAELILASLVAPVPRFRSKHAAEKE